MTRISSRIPRNIKAERTRLDLNQDELAARMGWTRAMVSDIETGRRRLGIDDLAPFCAALGLPLARLAFGSDNHELQVLGLRSR